jgi:hypothetical protein
LITPEPAPPKPAAAGMLVLVAKVLATGSYSHVCRNAGLMFPVV